VASANAAAADMALRTTGPTQANPKPPHHCTPAPPSSPRHTPSTKALAWQGDRWLGSCPPPVWCQLASPYHPRDPRHSFVHSIHPLASLPSGWAPSTIPSPTPSRDLFAGVAASPSMLLARWAAHSMRSASALLHVPLPPPSAMPSTLHLISPSHFSSLHLPKLVPNLCVLV